MDALRSIYPTADTRCDGHGWIKNPENPTGFFACRGCSACDIRRVQTAPPVAAASGPPKKIRILIEGDDGVKRPLEIVPSEPEVSPAAPPEGERPTTEKIRKVKSKKASTSDRPVLEPPVVVLPPPEAMHGAADEFGGEDYPPPEDYGANPHDLDPEPYRAPDALPGQLALVDPIATRAAVVESRPVVVPPSQPLAAQVVQRVAHTLDEVEAAGGYSVIYADPAWSYVQGGRGSTDDHYETMSIEQIKALPIGRLAAKDAVLFLWGTWPQLPVVLETMTAWGFAFKTCGFVWVKHHEGSGKECVGGGFWTRANSEFCLIGVRGKHPKRIDKTVRQLVQAPRGDHSAKPVEVRDRICKLMGELPAIELFARDRDERFDAWGDQVPGGSDVIL